VNPNLPKKLLLKKIKNGAMSKSLLQKDGEL